MIGNAYWLNQNTIVNVKEITDLVFNFSFIQKNINIINDEL